MEEAGKICVTGELRSFNNKRGEGAKLVITVFALAGSLLAVTLVRRLLGLDSRGRTAAQREDEEVKGA